MGWLINNRNSFSTVLEVGKSRIKVLVYSVSGVCSLVRGYSLLCPHMVEGAGELSGVPL